jgi:hypothetical protein
MLHSVVVSHSCCTTFGVAVTVVVPCLVLQALLLCHVWCCSCCHRATCGLTCAVIVPYLCCGFHHHAVRGVMGTVVVLHSVLQLLLSHRTWCRSCGGCCQATWCRSCIYCMVVVGVVAWLLHCMVLRLQPLHHVVSLNCEDCGNWTTKDEVSRKKENRKRKTHQQSKLAQGAWRDGTRSREGHGNVAYAVMRAQQHGKVVCNGEAQGVLSLPYITVVVVLLLSVVGPWWALEGEGVSIGKDADVGTIVIDWNTRADA